MSETNEGDGAIQPARPNDVHARSDAEQVEALWRAAGPVVQPLIEAAIAALERHGKNSGRITGLLLALVILTFGGIAAYALQLGRVDTAEKVLIALISFLGGAAMFSGAPKK
jgi:hypothetical protein